MARDYSSFSVAELRAYLSAINGEKYPADKRALEVELQARMDFGLEEAELAGIQDRAIEEETSLAESARKFKVGIAWRLILTAPVLDIDALRQLFFAERSAGPRCHTIYCV
jgi:hypothetical protein